MQEAAFRTANRIIEEITKSFLKESSHNLTSTRQRLEAPGSQRRQAREIETCQMETTIVSKKLIHDCRSNAKHCDPLADFPDSRSQRGHRGVKFRQTRVIPKLPVSQYVCAPIS